MSNQTSKILYAGNVQFKNPDGSFEKVAKFVIWENFSSNEYAPQIRGSINWFNEEEQPLDLSGWEQTHTNPQNSGRPLKNWAPKKAAISTKTIKDHDPRKFDKEITQPIVTSDQLPKSSTAKKLPKGKVAFPK